LVKSKGRFTPFLRGQNLTRTPVSRGNRKDRFQMAKRIYVGGLPYTTTDADLEALFANSGVVTSATVVSDRYSGASKGFGFVEMADDGEANAAIRALNGTTLSGRTITVNEARAREDRPSSGGRGRW
jgi:RNA recognition motif-containing protein